MRRLLCARRKLSVTQSSRAICLLRPRLGAPEGTAGKPGRGDEEDDCEDEDAGNECPSGFEAVHDSVEDLDEGYQHHQVGKGAACADDEERDEHDGEGSVARGEIAGIDAHRIVDFIVGRDKHGGMNESENGSGCHEERSEKDGNGDPPGNFREIDANALSGHSNASSMQGLFALVADTEGGQHKFRRDSRTGSR